jgi:hypothetical protein
MSKPAELRQIHVTAHQGYPQHDCPLCASLLARKFTWQPGELTAWDRAETDACERGTVGCSVKHTRDSECQTW